MIGLQDILVHAYLQLDRKRVHKVLRHNLKDVRAVQRMFASFL